MTLPDFKDSLKQTSDLEERLHFLRKNIFHGIPHVFDSREDEYFEFRCRIAEQFDINYQSVFIIGSAKLGFSYFKETQFSYNSDIDVAIVSQELFENFFLKICDYQYELDKFYKVPSERELEDYDRFLKYLVKGWMRPDLLPLSFNIKSLKHEWFNFFQSLSHGKSQVGNYKVAAGLYKNFTYLEKYHLNSINEFYKKITQ